MPSESPDLTPKEAILAACEEGEKLRGEATRGPWEAVRTNDVLWVGDDLTGCGTVARFQDRAFIVHAANHSPWGALRVLTEAIWAVTVECEDCPEHPAMLEEALAEAARVLQGQEGESKS